MVGVSDRWMAVGVEGVDEAGDEVFPRPGGSGRSRSTARKSRKPKPDGVAEAHDGLGVEGGIDGAGGLRLGDEVGEAVAAEVEGALHHAADLGVAAGGDEGLEQQGALRAHLVGDEVRADRGEDVGDLALEAVLVEELVELAVGAGLDGGQQQLGLAGEAAVDGAGGVAGPAGDLGHAGAVVALLGEHLGGGRDQLVPDRVGARPTAAIACTRAGSVIDGQDNDRYHACLVTSLPRRPPPRWETSTSAARAPHRGPRVDGLAGGLDAGGQVGGQAGDQRGRRRR